MIRRIILFAFVFAVLQQTGLASLERLEQRVQEDLQLLDFPEYNWCLNKNPDLLDVAIIGGGMAGTSAAFALQKLGVCNLHLFDRNPKGLEGPWHTTARMRTLQSEKTLPGPAQGVPSLTFQAWYKAQYGATAWEKLDKIPTGMWGDYLLWFREVLHLPVTNCAELVEIVPASDYFDLVFQVDGKEQRVYARKVILATGRDGCGGLSFPNYVQAIPKKYYAHAGEIFDVTALKGQSIAVVGAGASAFDLAAMALEHGAEKVDVLVRRSTIPYENKLTYFLKPGSGLGYYLMKDHSKVMFLGSAFNVGVPPPHESLERLEHFDNITFHTGAFIKKCFVKDNAVELQTNNGVFKCDRLLLGTGFEVDLEKQPYMKRVVDHVMRWSDRLQNLHPKLGRFPYLGRHFQLRERVPEAAPYLRHIHYFNFGAFMSHSILSGEVEGIARGAARLAEGVVMDLFLQEQGDQYEYFKVYGKTPNHTQDAAQDQTLFIDYDSLEDNYEWADLILE